MNKLLLAFFAFHIPLLSNAQAVNESVEQICQKVECRVATTVAVEDNAGNELIVNQPILPYAFHNTVVVLPGEHLKFEAILKDGQIDSVKYVKKVEHPDRTIAVGLVHQKINKTEKKMSLLMVVNPFNRPLVYKAILIDVFNKKAKKTTICPVAAKISGIETWIYPVDQILLHGFQLSNKTDALECKE